MNITGFKTGILTVPLRKPFKTALRSIDAVRSVVLRLETDAGVVGFGEAPPTGAITGESLGSIRGAIHEYIAPRLMGLAIGNLEAVLNALEGSCIKNTSAKAAVDMAVYDAFGKLHGVPLFKLFGGFRERIETDLTISVNSPAEMAEDARQAVARGFRILKVKVGKDPAQDIERLRGIREAVGAGIVLRVDANQGWTEREAIRIMCTLEEAGLGLELVEQPLPAAEFEGMRRVRERIATPMLADESVFSAQDAVRLMSMGAADYLNIKLMKTGGLRGALRICALAESFGVECFMGCMMETKLSVTAAAHLAAGKSIITRMDLDSAALCSEDPVVGGVVMDGPWLVLPNAPGLGILDVHDVVWDG